MEEPKIRKITINNTEYVDIKELITQFKYLALYKLKINGDYDSALIITKLAATLDNPDLYESFPKVLHDKNNLVNLFGDSEPIVE